MNDAADITIYRRDVLIPIKDGATYADIEALPDGVNGEIIAGQLWVSPRPASPHGFVASGVGAVLGFLRGGYGDGPGGWRIIDEPELHLGDDVLVPDVASWREERMPGRPNVKAHKLAPDWVCEVASPSTRRLDRTAKLPAYHRHGVEWAWILEPELRTLEVFRRKENGYLVAQTFSAGARVRAHPFDIIEIELGRLWGDPPGSAPDEPAEEPLDSPFAAARIEKYHRPLLVPIKDDATYADIEALPEGVNGEILDGRLWVSPRPGLIWTCALTQMMVELTLAFDSRRDGPGGWHILRELEFHAGDDVMVPRIAGWRTDRLPRFPDVPFMTIAPNWVCEVVAPPTRILDRAVKLPLYHRHGVEWVWIVDPSATMIEVYRHTDAGFALVETHFGHNPVRVRPFDAIELEVSRWWVDLESTP